MKHVWMLVALLAVAPVVNADEVIDAATLNRPAESVETAKRVVNVLEPGAETLYDLNGGEWHTGVSASLWNFASRKVHLASLRLGYADEQTIYTGLRADLPGLAERFVPETVKGYATAGPLRILWAAVGEYAAIGPFVGFDFDHDDARYGLSFGAAFQF